MFITKQNELAAFAQRASESPVLAIDTEFLRERTYYPQLCLLQMATAEEDVIVDPFEVKDLSCLKDVLTNPNVTKLFHAGFQDLEIIYNEIGVVVSPIFDTQIAAALLGHTQQIGYGALVANVCGVQLRKGDSFTDWSRRPLSKSQITYAADDVIYLPKLYQSMRASLEEQGRLNWLDNDFASLSDEKRYLSDSRARFRKLKRVSQLKPRQLSAARELAAWREDKAKKRNVPRKWILTDEQVVEACRREARSIDELFMVRGVQDRLNTEDARIVVNAICTGLDAPKEDWPTLNKNSKSEANVDSIVDAMNAIVRLRARQNNIAVQTLASHSDLAEVARGYEDVDVLKGWKASIVGDELREFLDGKIALSYDSGNLVVTKL